jgi:hypothetical protein
MYAFHQIHLACSFIQIVFKSASFISNKDDANELSRSREAAIGLSDLCVCPARA